MAGPSFDVALELGEVGTPSTPGAGRDKLYCKSDHRLYVLDKDGVETQVALQGDTANAAVSFNTNWADLAGGQRACGYRRDCHNLVHLRGLIKASAAQLANATMFTLPTGFRPTTAAETIGALSSVGIVQLQVATTGIVNCGTAIPLNGWVALTSITFYAD